MSAKTAFLSKLIGIYCVLLSLVMAASKQSSVQTIIALVHDAPLVFVVGLVIVAAGLAMILSHNVWSGGAVPVIVTLVGWLTLLKGLAFLAIPPPAAVGVFLWGSEYERFFYADMAIVFVLGAYLTYGGFRRTTSSPDG